MPTKAQLQKLLKSLVALPKETEWLEFKQSCFDPEEVGQYISALSNSAALTEARTAYLVWGVNNETHDVVGTSVKLAEEKVKCEELECWLIQRLSPRIDFRFHEFEYNNRPVSIIEIPAAYDTPVRFIHEAFIRVGSYKKRLRDFPQKEKTLWRKLSNTSFETSAAKSMVDADDVVRLLDHESYFRLSKQAVPLSQDGIIERLHVGGLVSPSGDGLYEITNLGAILFAQDLAEFPGLSRKALRVIDYPGPDKNVEPVEQGGKKGYASGFRGAVKFVLSRVPRNKPIVDELNTAVPVYPEIAIQEFLANALIHQDFSLTGTGPTVEIFSGRIEITNPGQPLIDVARFVDSPSISRNQSLAKVMRDIGICEEKGRGVDKALFAIEIHQLPPPNFCASENHTSVTMYCPGDPLEMDPPERIRACYQHACLRFTAGKKMTNLSFRKRLGLPESKMKFVGKIIQDAIDANQIKPFGQTGRRYAKYVPHWA